MTIASRAGAGRLWAFILVALVALAAATPEARAKGCEYTTLDRHCVEGGIYRILMPAGDGPFPVVVYLYGSGGHSKQIINYDLFRREIVDRGYALIVPAAKDLRYANGKGTGWSLRNEAGTVRDEAAFLRRVLADAFSQFRLDRKRILFMGQSRGAFLAWEIACHNPEMATAYAVHAGGYLGDLPARCRGPVNFLHGHGVNDPVVPLKDANWVSAGARMAPLEESLSLLARANGCQMTEPPRESRYFGFLRRSWQHCTSRRALDFLLHEGGHSPPRRWFRAVLDWFDTALANRSPAGAVRRSVGENRANVGGRFKAVPKRGASE